MCRSKFELEHASNSVALVHDIRTILNSTTEGRMALPQKVDLLVKRIDQILKQTPDAHVPTEWRVVVVGLRVLASQFACVAIAHGDEGNLLAERTRYDVLVGELRRLISSDSPALPDGTVSTRQSLIQKKQFDFDVLREFLLMIPLSTLYWQLGEQSTNFKNTTNDSNPEPNPMLRVIVFLDRDPIASPKLLKSNILYPLEFHLRGLTWPSDAIRLRLDLLTTCPSSEFSVSEFVLEPPNCIENGEYQGELAGQIKFNSGQSSLLDDILLTVRCAFETSERKFVEIPVIGHNELRLKIVDENKYPLMTCNQTMDRHIAELVEQLLSDCSRIRDELPNLLDMLQALTRLYTTYAQEAIFKERSDILESEFHATVLRDLRLILGYDVQKHPEQAGGIADIRYRGVIVELKVEKINGDRKHISKKYTEQATQYAGVEARQVCILLILDLTTKDKPPGDIRNDIMLTDVETHGGTDTEKNFHPSHLSL